MDPRPAGARARRGPRAPRGGGAPPAPPGGPAASCGALAAAAGGAVVRAAPRGAVATDSRALLPGQWFLPLTGGRRDGHAFLGAARRAGCAGAVAERVPPGWDRGFIRVRDTGRALWDLGRHAAESFPGPVVGLTGSCGKTTTRELAVLGLGGRAGGVHATRGNQNNHLGVPITLLEAPPDARVLLLEMGMSAPGELARLEALARPDVRVVTNVRPAHLEGCGSLAGVAEAKAELVVSAGPGDTVVLNADDPRVDAMAARTAARVVRFGSGARSDVQLLGVRPCGPGGFWTAVSLVDRRGGAPAVEAVIPSPGAHLGSCAAAAAAVAVALGGPVDDVWAARLRAYVPEGMRMLREEGPGGITVLNDAYNSSPASCASALESLAALPCLGKRVVLLGDMLELGPEAKRYHEEALGLARRAVGAGGVVGVTGPTFGSVYQARAGGAGGALWAETPGGLAEAVAGDLGPGDVVLVKGSRGQRMEAAVSMLLGEGGPT